MSEQYAHLHTMAKTSMKFQNDWPKTVGEVALTRHPLSIVDEMMNGRTDGSRHAYITPAYFAGATKTNKKSQKLGMCPQYTDAPALGTSIKLQTLPNESTSMRGHLCTLDTF